MKLSAFLIFCLLNSSGWTNSVPSGEPLVDITNVDNTILIDLRYASPRNFIGKPIYPKNMRCMVRESVGQRLKYAQHLLRAHGYGLKIWDAYRPIPTQQILWDAIRDPNYVADPAKGGSLHSWGVAVDVTLVDKDGREMKMPTDFDTFSPAAKTYYEGNDPEIAKNLQILQRSMSTAGFYVTTSEWWHFIAKDWQRFAPVKALRARPKDADAVELP